MSTNTDRLGSSWSGRGRSRRALMTGAAAGLGVIAADTLGAAPARAAQGSAVLEGQDNTGATSRTAVFTTMNNEIGILADPGTSGKGSLGVLGIAQDVGVQGEGVGAAGVGVFGVSRLFRWNDIISDQTIGAAPKTRMITAAGVTNDQPATVSARRCARDRPEGRP